MFSRLDFVIGAGGQDSPGSPDYIDWDYNFYMDFDPIDIEGTNTASGTPAWDAGLIPDSAGNLLMSRGGFTLLDASGNARSTTADYFGAYGANSV